MYNEPVEIPREYVVTRGIPRGELVSGDILRRLIVSRQKQREGKVKWVNLLEIPKQQI